MYFNLLQMHTKYLQILTFLQCTMLGNARIFIEMHMLRNIKVKPCAMGINTGHKARKIVQFEK